MTVKELRAEAKRRGIKVPPKARKAEILELLGGSDLTVLAAVDRDLTALAKRDRSIPGSALAATARQLARELDDPEVSAGAKSMCSKSLADILGRLGDLVPPERKGDQLDDLIDKRAGRGSAT